MWRSALVLIETKWLIAAIEATDAADLSANEDGYEVKPEHYYNDLDS